MIDWITVAAQIVNFLLLAAILRRFLYRPIVATMVARQQHIDHQLQEARHLKAQAERLIMAYRRRLEALEEEAEKRLEEARRAAEAEREARLEKVRLEVDRKRREWEQDLARQQAALLRELKTLLAEHLVELGRRALGDLAGRELETRVIERFLEKLAALPEDQRRLLAESTDPDWTVATTFPLDDSLRLQLEAALRQINSAARLRFEQRPELICGIALETDGRIWHWDLGAWLDELEAVLQKALPEVKRA